MKNVRLRKLFYQNGIYGLVTKEDISVFTAQDLRFDKLNDRLVQLRHNTVTISALN